MESIDDLCPIDALDEDQYNTYMSNRGGCRCFLCAPCSACVEPPTIDELDRVGFHDFKESRYTLDGEKKVDFSTITRSLCR